MTSKSVLQDDGDDGKPHQLLHPSGDSDAYRAGVLRKSWDDVDTTRNLIVVLDQVPFIDSGELAALVEGVKRYRAGNASLVLVATHVGLVRLLQTAAIDRLAPIVGSYAEAVDTLRHSQE